MLRGMQAAGCLGVARGACWEPFGCCGGDEGLPAREAPCFVRVARVVGVFVPARPHDGCDAHHVDGCGLMISMAEFYLRCPLSG